jgi:hypothetical protein
MWMNEQTLGLVTKQAAKEISRRRSLLSLGGMVLAASLFAPAATAAEKGKKKKNRCRAQIGQCREGITSLCTAIQPTAEEIQECFELFDQCCEFLTGPNTSGAFACAAEVIEDLSAIGFQSAK